MHKLRKSTIALCLFSASFVQAAPSALLKTLGLRQGQSYASAKTQLIQKGWKVNATNPSTRQADEAPPYGFKEVICGNGWQAVCSAQFFRNNNAVMLTLHPGKILFVDGASDD